jgi:outer membrane protein, heavy metal efflux system
MHIPGTPATRQLPALTRLSQRSLNMTVGSSGTRALICLAIALAASPIQAQEPEIPSSLTLEDAVRLTMDRNPALAAAKNEIQAVEGDKIAASKRLNPAFSLQFEDFPISAHPGPFFDVQEITSRVDYEIERGGRRRLRTESANQALEAQKLAYQDQVRLMRLQVERIFYRIILEKSNLEASRMILDQAERMISLNRVRFKQGDLSALDLNRIEVEKLKFQEDVFQADLALRNAKSSLLALLNAADLSRDIDVIGALPVGDQNPEPGLPPHAQLDELIRIALERRPDLASRLRQKRRADTETLLQRAIRSPNITVGGGYKRNLTDNTIVFGVTIPLNVFNRNEGEIIRADAEQMRALNLAAALRKEVQLDVQQARNAVEINRQRVHYIRNQRLKKAEEVSQVTLESYNLGGATLIDYLDAQRTYREALRIFNQALFDERISLYELSSSIALGVE